MASLVPTKLDVVAKPPKENNERKKGKPIFNCCDSCIQFVVVAAFYISRGLFVGVHSVAIASRARDRVRNGFTLDL